LDVVVGTDGSPATQLQAPWIGGALKEVIVDRPLSTVALALGLGFPIGVTSRRELKRIIAAIAEMRTVAAGSAAGLAAAATLSFLGAAVFVFVANRCNVPDSARVVNVKSAEARRPQARQERGG
jgi:hypothetical protein